VNRISPGTLKCVVLTGKRDLVLATLRERINPDNIRQFDAALLVHSELEPADLRDWLSTALGEGQSLLVFEFEKWSGYGADVDPVWLLERGH
jgi:hypothetical protein